MAETPAQVIMSAPAIQLSQPENTDTRDRKRLPFYNSKAARVTGIMQISCGVLAFVAEILILSIVPYGADGAEKAAIGVCGELMFIVTGIIGLLSAKKKRGMIVAYLVLSIISCIVAGVGLLFATGHISYARGRYDYRTAAILYLLVMIVEFLTGIVSSSFGCASGVCCTGQPIIHERVVYMAPPGPSQAYYNGPQVPMGLPPAYVSNHPDGENIEKQPLPLN